MSEIIICAFLFFLGFLIGDFAMERFDNTQLNQIIKIENAKENNCEYYINKYIKVIDKCGKFNIGDKLSIVKIK